MNSPTNRLSGWMQVRGISPETLAGHVGVSVPTIKNWASGHFEPDVSVAQQIAAFLGVAVDEIWPTTEAGRVSSIPIRGGAEVQAGGLPASQPLAQKE